VRAEDCVGVESNSDDSDDESDMEASDGVPRQRPPPSILASIYGLPSFMTQEEEDRCLERIGLVFGTWLKVDLIDCFPL
jgi:hypothetical protein